MIYLMKCTVRLVSKLGVHSRLWLLFVCTLLAAPLAVGTLHFPPPGAFGNLYMSNQYFFYINDIIRMSDRLLFSCRDLVCCPLHSHCGNCSSRDQVNKSFLKCFRICQLIFGQINLHCCLPLSYEPGWRKPPSHCGSSEKAL